MNSFPTDKADISFGTLMHDFVSPICGETTVTWTFCRRDGTNTITVKSAYNWISVDITGL